MIETKKIIQAVCYILQQIGRSDKLKLVKLLYLADKCHLMRYVSMIGASFILKITAILRKPHLILKGLAAATSGTGATGIRPA